MKLIRWFVAIILKGINALTLPSPISRSAEDQEQVNNALSNHSLYHLSGCPFCIKVRRQTHRLQLPIEERNIGTTPGMRDELIAGGGKPMVPCLRIDHDNGETQWMYESNDIIAYLKNRFEQPA